MSKSISISITGGSTKIDNIVQGDNVTITSASDLLEKAFTEALAELNRIKAHSVVNETEFGKVVSLLKELKSGAQEGTADKTGVSRVLKVIQENFSWAYSLCSDFVKIVFPMLL